MNNFLFENGTKFLFGGGCVREYLASFLARFGPSVLLVTEEEGRNSDAADEARDILRRSGKQTAECVVGLLCPRYEQVQQAARLCRERRVDLVLGVGGSAVLDFCKAASLAAVCRGELWTDFWMCQGVVDIPPLPVGLVSTAAEVGSINGPTALKWEDRYIWREYPPCDPKFALLDPAYTRPLSSPEFLGQGFSAFAGAVEQYLAPSEGAKVSCELLEALLRRIARDLDACRRDLRDDAARSDLIWACALCGSRLFQLGRCCALRKSPLRTAALRAAAETGGGYGEVLAVLLMARCRQEAAERPGRMARMARRVWELPEDGRTEQDLAQESLNTLEGFLKTLGLPAMLSGLESGRAEWLAGLLASDSQGALHALVPFLTAGRG